MSKPYSVSVLRNVGHPYTNEFGWDIMFVKTIDDATEDEFQTRAENAGWHLYMSGVDAVGDGLRMLMMIKPNQHSAHGVSRDWEDPSPWPQPEEW